MLCWIHSLPRSECLVAGPRGVLERPRAEVDREVLVPEWTAVAGREDCLDERLHAELARSCHAAVVGSVFDGVPVDGDLRRVVQLDARDASARKRPQLVEVGAAARDMPHVEEHAGVAYPGLLDDRDPVLGGLDRPERHRLERDRRADAVGRLAEQAEVLDELVVLGLGAREIGAHLDVARPEIGRPLQQLGLQRVGRRSLLAVEVPAGEVLDLDHAG
jgi:hypothetical protein